ncbi:MAG TPA: DUF2279 domain-containing protein [Spirochaetota bacterium]
MKNACACVLMCLFVFSGYAFSQDKNDADVTKVASDTKSNDKAVSSTDDESAKSVVRYSILGGTIPVIFIFGVKAWDWQEDHSFYSEREHWFGQNTDFGGADKAGHFSAHYMLERSMYQVFDWTENGGSRKWVYSIGTSMAVGLFIEVGDGFSSHYGFSYEDLVMDYLGILTGAVLDRFPVADGFIGVSARFVPTDGYKARFTRRNFVRLGLESVNDYSGWTYMMNFKLAGFERIGVHLPLALRLIQFDLGYRTLGYSTYDKHQYARPFKREIVYGISLNSAQLFDESISNESKHGGAYTTMHKFLEFYHVPVEKEFSHTL